VEGAASGSFSVGGPAVISPLGTADWYVNWLFIHINLQTLNFIALFLDTSHSSVRVSAPQ